MRTPRKTKKKLKKEHGSMWYTVSQYIEISKKIDKEYRKGDPSDGSRNTDYRNLSSIITMRINQELKRAQRKTGNKTYMPK